MAIYPNLPASQGLVHPITLQAQDSATATLPHATSDDVLITSTTTANIGTPQNFYDTPNQGDLSPDGLTLTSSNPDRQRVAQAVQKPTGRDNSRQRRALIKGTLGARHRQRWENDRLLSNPYLTPPTPADFLPCTTHPKKVVHYEVACLWDAQYRQQYQERQAAGQTRRVEPRIPPELKAGLKRAGGPVGIAKMLEVKVRDFVKMAAAPASPQNGWEIVDHTHLVSEDEHDYEGFEEDKEIIVFMPKGPRQQTITTTASPEVPHNFLHLPIYQSALEDPAAPFIRWLVHGIAEYYGLRSWSTTEQNTSLPSSPSTSTSSREVRVAYVGLPSNGVKLPLDLPRPLWVML